MFVTKKAFVIVALIAISCLAVQETHRAGVLQNTLALARGAAFQTTPALSVKSLEMDLDAARRSLREIQVENEHLRGQLVPLPQLRNEVKSFQDTASVSNPVLNEDYLLWVAKVNQLKAYAPQHSNQVIPEFQFLREKDWLYAAQGNLETKYDYAGAFEKLREKAKEAFAETCLEPALSRFQIEHPNAVPDMATLAGYFETPVDNVILQRWQAGSKSLSPNLGTDAYLVTETEVNWIKGGTPDRLVVGSNAYSWENWPTQPRSTKK